MKAKTKSITAGAIFLKIKIKKLDSVIKIKDLRKKSDAKNVTKSKVYEV